MEEENGNDHVWGWVFGVVASGLTQEQQQQQHDGVEKEGKKVSRVLFFSFRTAESVCARAGDGRQQQAATEKNRWAEFKQINPHYSITNCKGNNIP